MWLGCKVRHKFTGRIRPYGPSWIITSPPGPTPASGFGSQQWSSCQWWSRIYRRTLTIIKQGSFLLLSYREGWKYKLIIKIDQQSTLFVLLKLSNRPLSGKWGDFVDCKKNCTVNKLFPVFSFYCSSNPGILPNIVHKVKILGWIAHVNFFSRVKKGQQKVRFVITLWPGRHDHLPDRKTTTFLIERRPYPCSILPMIS